jgi:LPS sulfotransferase NodH
MNRTIGHAARPFPLAEVSAAEREGEALAFLTKEGTPLTEPASEPPQARVRMLREVFAAVGVRQSILLASSFRSGSTYVAELLRQNGVDGLSLERFNTIWHYSTAPDRVFRNAVSAIARSNENELFTSKIMWPHRNDLARCLRLERSDAAILAESFPDARWLWVKRRDKVRQGISFWRARKTGRWHVFDQSEEPELAYDYDEIRECYAELLTHDACWEDFFVQAGINPCIIEYERFCDNVPAQLRKVLQFTGRPVGKDIATTVELKKQRDGFTEEIYDRFMNDCHRYG